MNKHRRKEIDEVFEGLDDLLEKIEIIKDEEQEALDSLPENLNESKIGLEMQQAVDALENCIEDIGTVKENLELAKG